MRKKVILLSSLFAYGGQLLAQQHSHDSSRKEFPNVLIIYADDLGYGDLSCYGATRVSTPHIDTLAGEGVRFTNAHAVAATSTPSRYSLLTGEYAWRRKDTDIATGDAGMIIKPGQFTLADLFKSKGYRTAAIGKWHLGLGDTTGNQDWNAPLPSSLGDLGFDYHYIMAATADRVPCVFIEDGHVANYDPSAPIYVSYKQNFEGEPTGKDNPELLYNLKPSHGHDQSIVNGISRIGYMKGGGKALWKDENIADSITTHAIEFIRRQKDKPFFMYFATNDVHVPRFPHERFRGKSPMGLRGEAIMQFDDTVGRLLKALDEMGLTDNTLIILSSDNGPVVDDGYQDRATELLGKHRPAGPFRGTKYSAFEGGTLVPFIVKWTNHVKAGMVNNELLSQIDVMASLNELIGGRMPQNAAPDSQQRLQTLLGNEGYSRPYVIEQSWSHALCVKTKDWKFIEATDGPTSISWCPGVETGNSLLPQLYEVKQVYENRNVANQHPEIVKEMEEILHRERSK